MINEYLDAFIQSGTIISLDRESVVIGWGEREWQTLRNLNQFSFYFPDFFLELERPWFTHTFTLKLAIDELISELVKKNHQVTTHFQWITSYVDFFRNSFIDLQQKIAENELTKAVPFFDEQAITKFNSHQITHSLISLLTYAKTHSINVYGFWNQEEGMLGATPELLFEKIDDKTIKTMACAGTISIEELTRQGETLYLHDLKLIHEHRVVIDGIRKALNNLGLVEVEEIELLKLPNLCHLMTPIRLKLRDSFNFDQLVKALHPTPALGGYPKLKGAIWLKRLQQEVNRGRFGAPVGFFNPKTQHTLCYVAIRNVQWIKNKATIFAGCGVIKESVYEHEVAEIHLKLQAIKELLAL